jgi:hypothetical protein
VRVWVDGGQAWRQGSWLTAVLWIVSLGAHLGYDYLVEGKGAKAGLGSAQPIASPRVPPGSPRTRILRRRALHPDLIHRPSKKQN